MPQIRDRDRIRDILHTDPYWSVYPLGDLAPGLFAKCEWHVPAEGHGDSLALVVRAFETPIFWATGTAQDLESMLGEIEGERFYLQVRAHHMDVLKERFEIASSREMVRMFLSARKFRAAPGHEAAGRLDESNLSEVESLFADGNDLGEAPDFFFPDMLSQGIFYGVRDVDGVLISVAGTHLVNLDESVGAIGNVYTRRDARGLGHASAATSAVLTELRVRNKARVIALNVKLGNDAAFKTYERLGFERHCHYVEGMTAGRRG